MLICLPILTFVGLFLTLLGLQTRRAGAPTGMRGAFLQTAAFTGAYLLLSSEILSLFELLTGTWVALSWAIALLGTGWLGWRTGLIAAGLSRLRARRPRPGKLDLAAGAGLGLILGLLFLTAVIAPPNNNDSLQYHMSRVMHWSQGQSLKHYATSFEPQLINPIGAETAILNARLLVGSDRLAGLLQWGSYVLVLVGVSAMTALLGGGSRVQWAAAAFAASLPMSVLQATSTQNDLVAAGWLIALLYFVLLSVRRPLFRDELASLAIALGAGLLTKGTFYPYALLPAIALTIQLFRNHRPRAALARGLVIGAIVLALNLGYWGRNMVTYGGPLGPSNWVRGFTRTSFAPGALAGSLARSLALNLATPDDGLNQKIVDGLKGLLGSSDPEMGSFGLMWGWNHEDLAGNPLHLLLIGLSLALLLINLKGSDRRLVIPYLTVVLGSYVVLAAVVRAGTFDARYQLAFFAAWAPLFGLALQGLRPAWLPSAVVAAGLVAALPWVLFNRTRPLIAMRDSSDPWTIPCLAGCTTGSILNEPQSSIIFGVWRDLREPYMQAAARLRASSCRDVGLKIDSHDPEYLFWWLLEAPQSGIRLETVNPAPGLERYLDPTFRPCAVLCTICRGEERAAGLSLAEDFSGLVRLYLEENSDPGPAP
jgi:hypothetical protein